MCLNFGLSNCCITGYKVILVFAVFFSFKLYLPKPVVLSVFCLKNKLSPGSAFHTSWGCYSPYQGLLSVSGQAPYHKSTLNCASNIFVSHIYTPKDCHQLWSQRNYRHLCFMLVQVAVFLTLRNWKRVCLSVVYKMTHTGHQLVDQVLE